jgi:hypothetical protein
MTSPYLSRISPTLTRGLGYPASPGSDGRGVFLGQPRVSGTSANYGGGIFADSRPTVTLANRTVSGNSGAAYGRGIPPVRRPGPFWRPSS